MSIEACPGVLDHAHALRRGLDVAFRDQLVEAIYEDAETVAARVVRRETPRDPGWDVTLDQVLTSRVFGLPITALGLAAVFWLTIVGANYPSAILTAGLFAIESAKLRVAPRKSIMVR